MQEDPEASYPGYAVTGSSQASGQAISRSVGDLASLSDRFCGALIDSLIIGAVIGIPAFIAGLILGLIPFIGVILAFLFGLCWGLAVSFFYHVVLEGKNGQTIGKKAMRIKVVTTDGASYSQGRALTRWLGRLVSVLTFGIGVLMIFWDPNRQSLHDKIGKTLVVQE